MRRLNRGACVPSGRKLSRFARKCSGTGQRLRPGDELHPDKERSIRLNARGFQETLTSAGLTSLPPRRSRDALRLGR